jgi:hypothetical protein
LILGYAPTLSFVDVGGTIFLRKNHLAVAVIYNKGIEANGKGDVYFVSVHDPIGIQKRSRVDLDDDQSDLYQDPSSTRPNPYRGET